MFDEVATVCSGQALVYLLKKPGVVIQQSLDRFPGERFGIAATFSGDAREPAFQLWRQVQWHWASVPKGRTLSTGRRFPGRRLPRTFAQGVLRETSDGGRAQVALNGIGYSVPVHSSGMREFSGVDIESNEAASGR